MEQIKVERGIWIDVPREQAWQTITDPADLVQCFCLRREGRI